MTAARWGDLRAALERRPPRRQPAPTAAVALILTPRRELLLIRRAEHPRDHWSGHMALPGGRRDPGDADLLETARRETREETGIDLARADFLGELDDLAPLSSRAPAVVVRPFVFGLERRGKLAPSDEVAGHLWIGLDALQAAAGTAEVAWGERRARVDAFLVSEPPVWGMTHRIITGLFELIA